MNFGSHTDLAVAVAAGLVNVATPGQRRGRPWSPPVGKDLVTQVNQVIQVNSNRRTALLPPRQAVAVTDVARTARPIFELADVRDFDQACRIANKLLGKYRPAPALERHDGQPWHLHFHGERAVDPSGWGGGISIGLATVLGSPYADRLGVCDAPACDRVFVDVSRNGMRRFCSTACQNRVKAATHRARTR